MSRGVRAAVRFLLPFGAFLSPALPAPLPCDGNLDLSFGVVDHGPTAYVNHIAVQRDGKIVIHRNWLSANFRTNRTHLLRLHPDGEVDSSYYVNFETNKPWTSTLKALVLQSDDRLVVGGEFTNTTEFPRAYLARLNHDGTVDDSFAPVLDGPVTKIVVRADDRIVIAGHFTRIDNLSVPGVARLLPDGTPDSTFRLEVTAFPAPDGRFYTISNNRTSLMRFNSEGTPDQNFQATIGDEYVRGVFFQSDGKIVLAVGNGGLRRLNADGSLDESFRPPQLILVHRREGPGGLFGLTSLPAGKLLIYGGFSKVNGVRRNLLARLNPDGSLDETFEPDFNFWTNADDVERIYAVAPQNDGTLLVGGFFRTINGFRVNGIAKLHESDAPCAVAMESLTNAFALPDQTKLIRNGNGLNIITSVDAPFQLQRSSNLKEWTTLDGYDFGLGIPSKYFWTVNRDAVGHNQLFYRVIRKEVAP